MSKYSLSNYITLSASNLSLENIQEELFLSASENYLEEVDPPRDTIKRIRQLLESNIIQEAILHIKEENPTLFSYYIYQELLYKISILINKINQLLKESSNIDKTFLKEANIGLENLKMTRRGNNLPIQEIEYVDSIFEKINY